jgi:hypothetical protein
VDATPDNHPGDQEPGWVPLAEAADQLGVSKDALRRRIRRGTIPNRKIETRYGPTYEVRIEDVAATVADGIHQTNGHHPGTAATVTPATLAQFAALVRDLSERSERNAAAAAMWQARAELLAVQLGQAQERIKALEAPINDAYEMRIGGPPDAAVAETAHESHERERRAWWRFW